ncbi:MAG: gliding motility-associated C-terminal domain-containing protein, partial [Bacteroidetes bacterium]|nr:gliding motility-associated C-terminal domain-containing protein [Bacteroidota bacterium]
GLAAGTYTVIVSDANSCSRQTSVTVLSVVSTLTLTTASSGSGCGTSMNGTLSAAITGGGIAPYTYSWNTNPPQTTSSVSNLPAGTYTVLVTDAKGCTVQSVDSIAVSSQPKTLFTSVQNISCEGISVQFANTSTQASSYLWNFGDQSTSTELNPTHTFPSTGTFVVTLVAEKPPCSDTVSTDIVIGGMGATAIGTANIFTPNGDGQNDCFTLAPDTAYAIKKCLYLEVFDRWGVKMFESSGSDNYCWDGKNKKDNKQAVGGTYYYVAKLGETTIKGYVTLIR